MSRRSHPRRSNRRELSQNFLRDPQVITQMCDLLAGSSLPVLDLGAGAGAVTGELVRRGFGTRVPSRSPGGQRPAPDREAAGRVAAGLRTARLPALRRGGVHWARRGARRDSPPPPAARDDAAMGAGARRQPGRAAEGPDRPAVGGHVPRRRLGCGRWRSRTSSTCFGAPSAPGRSR